MSDDIIKTSEIPHKKFTIPIPWNKKCGKKATYYIAEIPHELIMSGGDFQIHEKIEGNNEGYGGAVLEFLMEDGTIEKVKGPFYKYKDGHHRILMNIIKHLRHLQATAERAL